MKPLLLTGLFLALGAIELWAQIIGVLIMSIPAIYLNTYQTRINQ